MEMHTKGPWTVQELDKGFKGYPDWNTYAVRSPQNVCLAVVGDVDRYHEKDHEANAKLMALAPELLDALKAVIGDESNTAYPLGIKPWLVIETIAKVNAAIAKAEGR